MKGGALLHKTSKAKHGFVNPWIEAKPGAPGYIQNHVVLTGRGRNQKQQLGHGRAVQMHEMVHEQIHETEFS